MGSTMSIQVAEGSPLQHAPAKAHETTDHAASTIQCAWKYQNKQKSQIKIKRRRADDNGEGNLGKVHEDARKDHAASTIQSAWISKDKKKDDKTRRRLADKEREGLGQANENMEHAVSTGAGAKKDTDKGGAKKGKIVEYAAPTAATGAEKDTDKGGAKKGKRVEHAAPTAVTGAEKDTDKGGAKKGKRVKLTAPIAATGADK